MVIGRRALLRAAGLSAGSALVLAGCGGTAAGGDDADTASDIELLGALIELEQTAVAGYTVAARRLGGSLGAVARRFRDHEREHVDRLSLASRRLGGTPPAPRARLEVRVPRGERAILRHAVGIEDAAIAAYLDALPRLRLPELRATAGSIFTTEAEHLAVLRDALGEDPAPVAFVDGTAP
ncbi:MAG TPA: DUF4439 domain-containing protein [Solirubrobacteraceae bacterium]